jgi:NTE family protein
VSLSAGKIFKQTTELRFGITHNDGRTVNIGGIDSSINDDFTEGFLYTRLFHDSLDNLSFPNTGLFNSITFKSSKESLDSDSNYDQLQMLISGAETYNRYTVYARAMLETTIDENAPYNALFRHGGFLELSGTLDRELAGQHFGLIEAAFYRRLGNITFLPMYTGFSLESGNVWDHYDDINSDNTKVAGSLFIGADTFIGPLYLAIGLTDNGENALYFNLGQTFLKD